MGLGFTLLLVFIFVPLTGMLLLAWLFTRKNVYGKGLGFMWMGVLGLLSLLAILQLFRHKRELLKSDIYGEYIIDRTKFAGKQADWQYDHFRFEVTPQEDLLFYLTDKEEITRTYRGKVEFIEGYSSPRIVLRVDTPGYQLIDEKPVLYRNVWDFYYVFNSTEFGNVFFTKGHWKPIGE